MIPTCLRSRSTGRHLLPVYLTTEPARLPAGVDASPAVAAHPLDCPACADPARQAWSQEDIWRRSQPVLSSTGDGPVCQRCRLASSPVGAVSVWTRSMRSAGRPRQMPERTAMGSRISPARSSLLVGLLVIMLSGMFLPGCAPSAPPTPAAILAAQAFIVSDGVALLEQLPVSHTPLVPPDPAPAEAQAAWANPVVAWMQVGTQAVTTQPHPDAARTLASLAAGLHDGLLVADLARADGMAVSDDAMLATTASMILAGQMPLQQAQYQTLAQTATWVGVWQERSDGTAVANGIALGQAVAPAVLAFLADDHAVSAASDVSAIYRPVDPVHGGEPRVPEPDAGVWQLTPPRYLPPALPHWGAVRPIGFVHLDDLNVVDPPAWESGRFTQARDTFVQIQADRAAGLTTLGRDTPSLPDPVAIWMQQTHDLVTQADLRGHAAAQVYAATTAALHDGFILAYRGKYDHLVERPVTWMQQTDPTWMPAHDTPPTPSYPCETTVVSAAVATVLLRAFPDAQDAIDAQVLALREAGVRDGVQWPIDIEAGDGLGAALGRRLARQGVLVGR